MMTNQPAGLDAAIDAVRAHTSPRAQEIRRLESYVLGTQYECRPSFWSDRVPLWERAPCIVYPAARNVIMSNVDLVLGEGRFPMPTSRPSEDEGDSGGLDDDQSESVDRLISEVIRQTKFKSHCRSVLAEAQGSRSGVGLFGVRGSKLFAETSKAQWCTPALDADGSVDALEIAYPYLDQYQRPDGTWSVRALMYRRSIDAQRDVTYLPAQIDKQQKQIAWVEDPSKTVDHGLGFCPVVWYPFMRTASTVNRIDGYAVHEHTLDQIEALDFALSQRHRAALFLGEPQIVITGCDKDVNPTDTGRAAMIPSSYKGGTPNSTDAINGAYGPQSGATSSGGGSWKKGPGYPWRFEDKDVKVDMLELRGDSLKALDDHARDLLSKLHDSLCFRNLDPDNIRHAAATSGKAIELLKGPQLDRCDQIRDDFGENYLLRALNMLIRIAVSVRARGALNLPALEEAMPALDSIWSGTNSPSVNDDGDADVDAA